MHAMKGRVNSGVHSRVRAPAAPLRPDSVVHSRVSSDYSSSSSSLLLSSLELSDLEFVLQQRPCVRIRGFIHVSLHGESSSLTTYLSESTLSS